MNALEVYGRGTDVGLLVRCEPSKYEEPATPYSVSKAVRMSHLALAEVPTHPFGGHAPA